MCESASSRVRKVFVRLFPREQQPVVSHDLVEVDPVLDQQSDLDVHRVQVLLQGLIVPDQLGDLNIMIKFILAAEIIKDLQKQKKITKFR
jgi:hypothetical protein